MLYDIEDNFSDIETESLAMSDTDSHYDFSYSNLIQDTHFYSHSNSYKNQEFKNPFDTEDFPMDLRDIREEIEEPNKMITLEEVENVLNNNKMLEAGEILHTVMVPVINVKTEDVKYYKSDSEESEISSHSSVSCKSDNDEEHLENEEDEDPKYWAIPPSNTRRKRQPSSESDDADWEPEEKQMRRKTGSSSRVVRKTEGAKRVPHKPVPQLRKTGTKKITQWILSLLRDPQYNPRVITWENEDDGIFYITDTTKYAKLWGERKKNPSMNYEKLSRAMRYYYKNGELISVEKRTTYQFGPMSDYWRSRS